MSTTQAIAMEYEELEGSPTEELGDGFRATRKLKCAWSDRLRLARQFRGGLVGAVLYLPQTYDEYPLATVRNVGIAPFYDREVGAADDLRDASYNYAVLTVSYETPQGRSSDDRQEVGGEIISEDLSFAKEFLTVPRESLYYDSDHTEQVQEGGEPGLIVSMMSWEVTKHGVTSIANAYKDLVGKVNDSLIVSKTLGLSFSGETLLYDGLSLRRSISADGERTLDVTARFLHREKGWNKFYNPKAGTWQYLFREGSADAWKPFELDDFTRLT